LQPRSAVLALAFSLFFSTLSHAGDLTGRVLDPSGRPVAGAQVIVSSERGVLRTARTDADGRFLVGAPDTGRYDVIVAADGFRAAPVPVEAQAGRRDLGAITLAMSAVTESIVVSAAQVDLPVSQSGASVTVITGRELEARQVVSVAEALRTVPGLAVVATGSHGAVTGVFPRGGESNFTLVFVDGVPANAFGGDFDFAHLSTDHVERIEIVRGPQSALFGSNAIGAVVRVITRRGGPPSGAASLEAGSFGTSRLTAGGSGSAGPWDWGVSTERFASDGFNGRSTAGGEIVRNDDYERRAFTAAGGWRGAAGAVLRADMRLSQDERGFPGAFGSNPAGLFGGIDDVSRGDYIRWTAGLAGALPLTARLRTQATLGFSRMEGTFLSPFGESESSSRRASAQLQADVAFVPAFDLSAGLDLLAERAGSTYITGAAFQPIPVERRVAGYFAEGRWRASDRLFVTGGLRVDDIRRHALEAFPDLFSPRPALPRDTVVSVNPRIAAAWFVTPVTANYTRLRAAAGTGIRPPDAFELAFTDNPSLRPERSASAEAGLEQALAGGRVVLEATAFANEYDDLIIAVGSFAESSRYRTDNISNARARGLELSAAARARLATRTPVHLDARVGYTFLSTEVLAVDNGRSAPPPFEVGEPLLRRPRHQFSADLGLQVGRLAAFVRGGGRGRALDVEPNWGTFGGLYESAGYQVWHAGAAWRLAPRLDLFGRVTNLFDRAYEEAFGFPALGRGASAGLRVAAGR
jgi:outer membrane cobalamin receptor